MLPLVLVFGILLCVLLALLFYRLSHAVENRAAQGALAGLSVAALLYGALLGAALLFRITHVI